MSLPTPAVLARQRLYKRLILATYDLIEATSCLTHLNQRAAHPLEPTDVTLIGALTTNIVVAYGRMFGKNEGADKILAALPDRFVKLLSEDERRVHLELMNLRNTEFAHSDGEAASMQVHAQEHDGQVFVAPVSRAMRMEFDDSHRQIIGSILGKLHDAVFKEVVAMNQTFEAGEIF